MKKFLMILCVLSGLAAKCQLGWEDFYSEKDFRIMFQQAKNSKERIFALGLLGRKGLLKDSIMREINAIADKGDDKKLKASALWWDAKLYDDDTTKMIKLFQFAEQTQLIPFQVAANLQLADYYIHHGSGRSLYYAKAADSLLERLHGTTKERDSLKIDVFRRIAHAYIHNDDAVNIARYLLPLRNYAERNTDEHIRLQAVEVLADLYGEGYGDEDKKRSIPWNNLLYDHYKKTNQVQKSTGQTFALASIHSQLYLNDSIPEYKIQAIRFFKELDGLVDSLQVYGSFIGWMLRWKVDLGLVNGEEAIKLVRNDYNSHYQFSAQQKLELKLQIYLASNQFDSLKVYISKVSSPGVRSYWLKEYYLKKGDFDKAIPVLIDFQESSERNQRVGNLEWIYDDLVKAYVGKKDYKLAYEYKLKSLQIKDTLDKLASKEEIASMEMQKQIELQRAAFDDEQSKIALKNNLRFYGLIAGIAILLLLAGILWKNNRRKQKDKLKIEKAYKDLQLTQQQLIQSEKMASLGELTAGIAHEIQNPLNFVNNFSDVNTELVDEAKLEMDKGNVNEVKTILNDIKDNEQKINHHGKRAEAIVKGMLQHSRANSGQKELSDINALAEEYLRLAYHGLRAKDKSFTANFKTDLDGSIGRISIIPQDMGRVILNLINNAFYAVNDKEKENLPGYEPTVSVSTRKEKDKIEIKVKDNGNGIPQRILSKIFQPFFTTKPTGQGTGLGLSLSYDIITKGHAGELKVETKEGEGSEFIIQLPITN